ncbi:hypothetical protein [Dactylosporangium sp. NPDC048998]|uniref:hypothetical protein n=1 Tax=Dactylosporangium sp. NPDC048998 TaxID=3363976 RepID=UPI00371A6569
MELLECRWDEDRCFGEEEFHAAVGDSDVHGAQLGDAHGTLGVGEEQVIGRARQGAADLQ